MSNGEKPEEDLNELRLVAHGIIAELYHLKAISHLRLLLNHCQSSILELDTQDEAEHE